MRFDRFDLAILRPFLAGSSDGSSATHAEAPPLLLAGIATGTGQIVGDVSAPEFVALDLAVDAGRVVSADYAIEGPFLIDAKMKEPLSRPRGRVDLDLTAAKVDYGELFTKPVGRRFEVVSRFVPEKTGEVVFEAQIALREVPNILIQGTVADSTSIALTTPEFNLSGWSEIFPSLAPYSPTGTVAFEGLSMELRDGAPRRFDGRLALRGVAVDVPDAGRVRLRGSVAGDGTRLRTRSLKVLIAGATVGIEGAIDDPFGAGDFDLEVATQGAAEVNDLMTELAASGGRIFGPLILAGKVRGNLGQSSGWMETLVGDLRFSVGEGVGGRLRGVSILQTVLDQFPLLGGAARLSQPFRSGRSVDDYFSERFELIEGAFVLGEGKVDARTLRLVYPGYEARLSGPMRLRDFGIDMTGEILLKGDLVSAIGGLAGARMAERKPIRIQLARVTNTLDDPKVKMTKETLAIVPKLLFQATGLDTITLGIGKGIGEGLKKGAQAVLDGALGGSAGKEGAAEPQPDTAR